MENLKEELKYGKKGITLISLVVTIVVLLILAGVSIATLTGDNGILNQATKAKEKTEEAQKKEQTDLANLDKYIDSYTDTPVFLEGKSAIFFGDSVAYGYSTNGNGFGYYINQIANFSNFTNAAKNTATINTSTQGSNNIITQMKENKDSEYDFVIIEGGYGDLRDTLSLGELTDGYKISEYDTTTFAGAVEYSLYLVTTYWPNSRIGFIISYDTPNSNYGVRPNHTEAKKYWDIVKRACDKWNVQYLDFFEGSTEYNGVIKTYSDLFEVTSNTYLASDNIHPTATGYEFICPFISKWMKTLRKYQRSFDIDTSIDDSNPKLNLAI